jgi:hypothetical protein
VTHIGENDQSAHPKEVPVHRIRLPGFITDDAEIGLGDALKRASTYLGLRPCGGCGRRAAALNRWLTFTR